MSPRSVAKISLLPGPWTFHNLQISPPQPFFNLPLRRTVAAPPPPVFPITAWLRVAVRAPLGLLGLLLAPLLPSWCPLLSPRRAAARRPCFFFRRARPPLEPVPWNPNRIHAPRIRTPPLLHRLCWPHPSTPRRPEGSPSRHIASHHGFIFPPPDPAHRLSELIPFLSCSFSHSTAYN